MPLREIELLTKTDALLNPDCTYVFGDNVIRAGRGGQAKEMRGLSNSIGIPTKWNPGTDETSYFSDSDFSKVLRLIQTPFNLLERTIIHGNIVIWPSSGIGTGRAQLKTRAPVIFDYIRSRYRILIELSENLGGQ